MHVVYFLGVTASIIVLIAMARLAITGRAWPTDRIIEEEAE